MRCSSIVYGKAGRVHYDHKRLGKWNPWLADKKLPKTMFVDIHAQQSTAAPPLGPVLGARGITVMKFNDDFNNRSVQYEWIVYNTFLIFIIVFLIFYKFF